MAKFAPDLVQGLCKTESVLALTDMKKIMNISIATILKCSTYKEDCVEHGKKEKFLSVCLSV